MPRKGEVRRRDVLPDPKYHDRLVTKFMNTIMASGKKSQAERTFYGALDLIATRTSEEPLAIINEIVEGLKITILNAPWVAVSQEPIIKEIKQEAGNFAVEVFVYLIKKEHSEKLQEYVLKNFINTING